jgi:hypothetical protein
MKECAFDNGATKCKALSEKKCEGCRFYKTIDQVFAGRQKAEKRIRSLPPTAQAYIKRKYYS